MTYFIRGRERTIGDLFGEDFTYGIPGYQRPYAWTSERAVQLLDDVAAARRRGRLLGPNGGHYYLGNVILSRPEGSPVASIVDGQQRLITLTILLALLRDRGGAMADAAARAIADERGQVRLKPREQDVAFLREFAQAPGATSRAPETPLAPESDEEADDDLDDEDEDDDLAAEDGKEAAQAGEGEVDEESDEDDDGEDDEEDEQDDDFDEFSIAPALAPVHDSRRAMLANRDAMRRRLDALVAAGETTADDLTFFLLRCCWLIQVMVPNDADAHRVFNVMHTRGLPLTETDVLKSEVLGAIADPREAQACQEIWEEAEARLGRDEFELLFSHLRTIRLQSRARKAIFVELREAYAPDQNPVRFVRDVVEPAVDQLEAVLEGRWRCAKGSQEHADEINRRLVRLGLLPHASWVPVALRVLERFGEDAGVLVELVRKLDALSYGLFLLEPREERIRRFIAVLAAIDAGRSARELCTGELELTRTEAYQLAAMITRGSLRSSALKRVVLLRRLDSEQLTGIGPLPDYEDTNVEHVLPESPPAGSQWQEWFPKPKGFVQNLGNLIVIPVKANGLLGNEELTVKQNGSARKEGYSGIHARLGYGLLPEVIAAGEWTPAIVSERQRRFEDLLLELWGLQRPDAQSRAAAKRERRRKNTATRKRKKKAATAAAPSAPGKRRRRRRRRKSAG